MDRLSAVTRTLCGLICMCLGAACDDGPPKAPPQAEGRVNAVMASKKKQSFADLCDVAPDPAKPISWPELSAGADTPAPTNRYRWVNVWATWCKPCIEELPLLTHSFADWKKQGQDVVLTLLSVDADADAAKSFIGARAGLPASLQLKEAAAASAWLSSVGLTSGSAIPVHMVLDAQDKLLCARSGGISQADLERFRGAMFP
jgi:thiol-disulfide isomerase/thioredoxin